MHLGPRQITSKPITEITLRRTQAVSSDMERCTPMGYMYFSKRSNGLKRAFPRLTCTHRYIPACTALFTYSSNKCRLISSDGPRTAADPQVTLCLCANSTYSYMYLFYHTCKTHYLDLSCCLLYTCSSVVFGSTLGSAKLGYATYT
jgi:hypothetical protein